MLFKCAFPPDAPAGQDDELSRGLLVNAVDVAPSAGDMIPAGVNGNAVAARTQAQRAKQGQAEGDPPTTPAREVYPIYDRSGMD